MQIGDTDYRYLKDPSDPINYIPVQGNTPHWTVPIAAVRVGPDDYLRTGKAQGWKYATPVIGSLSTGT